MAERPYVQITDKHLAELKALLSYLKIEYAEETITELLQKGLDLIDAISFSIERDGNETQYTKKPTIYGK